MYIVDVMTPSDLQAWLTVMRYTQKQGADALGISRSAIARMLAGSPIDKRTALACAALAGGLKPWPGQAHSEAKMVWFLV